MAMSDFELDLIPHDAKRFAEVIRGDGTSSFFVEQRQGEVPEDFARRIGNVTVITEAFTALIRITTREYGDDYLSGAIASEVIDKGIRERVSHNPTSIIHRDYFEGEHVDDLAA
jgi:hypothetical protein